MVYIILENGSKSHQFPYIFVSIIGGPESFVVGDEVLIIDMTSLSTRICEEVAGHADS